MAFTTINDPSLYFQIGLYTGNGNDDKAIGLGSANFTGEYVGQDIQPDFLWIKQRSGATRNHNLTDSTRGVTAHLFADVDEAEASASNRVKSFDSNGFTLGDSSYTNDADDPFVGWVWKANGGTTTSNGASGDIKASVTQREDTAKFAICTYTGTGINAGQSHRVNHGLGTTPHVMLFKNRGAGSTDWVVYHHKNTSAPATDYLVLNEGNATADSANKFNDTLPGSAYATIGGDDNISSNTMVLYCWAEVQGYSKFGSYTGNGSTDGPFIYLGFKPSWIMTKRTDNTGSWLIHDNKRNGINPDNDELEVNTSAVEVNNDRLDILSNGFKIRNSAGYVNADSATYVYMAFAEHPFTSSKGVPTTAR